MSLLIDNIIRSKRTTLALEVNPDASLTVRAPYSASDRAISIFVEQQKAWINKARQSFLNRPQYVKKHFVAGEVFQFLGNDYYLNDGHLQKKALILRDNFYLATWAKLHANKHFLAWYKQQAKDYIPQRVSYFAKLHSLQVNAVKINSAKKRYGSCSIEGNINFTWRLMMAPPRVIDYVVVHELAHLVHHNHSSAFWQQVALMMPDYKQYVQWLNVSGHLLDF